jgi:hypothetical protein
MNPESRNDVARDPGLALRASDVQCSSGNDEAQPTSASAGRAFPGPASACRGVTSPLQRRFRLNFQTAERARVRILAALFARALHEYCPSLGRGRRESRVPAAPGASRAKWIEHTSIVTTGSDGFTRLSPRNGFNGLYRALPGDRALLPPSSRGKIRKHLTPASGCQDHTTSPSASALSSNALSRA